MQPKVIAKNHKTEFNFCAYTRVDHTKNSHRRSLLRVLIFFEGKVYVCVCEREKEREKKTKKKYRSEVTY